MKTFLKTSLILLLVCGFFSFEQLNTVKLEKATIAFETYIIDYGEVIQGANGTRIFNFTNTGSAPLLITNVKSSCGCTVPNYSKEPIEPGDSGQIEVKYNTNRLGAFSKTVTVISNNADGNKRLTIKGTVVTATQE